MSDLEMIHDLHHWQGWARHKAEQTVRAGNVSACECGCAVPNGEPCVNCGKTT